MNEITTEEIDSIIQDLINRKSGEFTDVIQLKNNYSIDNIPDCKKVLRKMVSEDLVVPHPGSKYKIKQGVVYKESDDND